MVSICDGPILRSVSIESLPKFSEPGTQANVVKIEADASPLAGP